MNGPVFVACDMGTTLVKAGVVDLAGNVLGLASVDSRLITQELGVVEQDLLEIERAAHSAISLAIERAGRRSDIAGVSFSSQMAGIGAVGEDFIPVAPFDSWLDSRCNIDIHEMKAHAERVTLVSGGPPTYSHGTKQRWLKREQPQIYAATVKFQVPGPFVAARLAGLSIEDAYIDEANLCFSNLADTNSATWSPELIALFGLDIEKLPRILNPLDIIGWVTPQAAITTGIPEGTPIAAGGGDQVVACLGAGVSEPGQASDSAGTASLFAMCLDRWAPDVERMSMVTAKAIGSDRYLSFSYVNGGGLGLEWFRNTVVADSSSAEKVFAELELSASKVPAGSVGLMWLPHFQGGVTPPKPHLRSGWIGITGIHGRGHLYRSVLEGIAYQYGEWASRAPSVLGAPLTEVRAMGGGAKSALWLQIKADVLGVPFLRMSQSECALLGNALIAASATRHISDISETVKGWHSMSSPVTPDAMAHESYRRLLEIFGMLTEQTDPVFIALQDFLSA